MAATPRRRRGSHDDIPLASHLPVDAAAALRRRRRYGGGTAESLDGSVFLRLKDRVGFYSFPCLLAVLVFLALLAWYWQRRGAHGGGDGHGTVLGRGSLGPRRRRLPSMRFFFTMLLISQFASTTRWQSLTKLTSNHTLNLNARQSQLTFQQSISFRSPILDRYHTYVTFQLSSYLILLYLILPTSLLLTHQDLKT